MTTFARIAGALLCLQQALSAEFRKSSRGPSAPDLIEMAGELIQGDEASLLNRTEACQHCGQPRMS